MGEHQQAAMAAVAVTNLGTHGKSLVVFRRRNVGIGPRIHTPQRITYITFHFDSKKRGWDLSRAS